MKIGVRERERRAAQAFAQGAQEFEQMRAGLKAALEKVEGLDAENARLRSLRAKWLYVAGGLCVAVGVAIGARVF